MPGFSLFAAPANLAEPHPLANLQELGAKPVLLYSGRRITLTEFFVKIINERDRFFLYDALCLNKLPEHLFGAL